MRICIASGTYHPDVGGPPTYLLALAADLSRRGHALKVVTYGAAAGRYPYPIVRVPLDRPAPLRLAMFALATLRVARGADLLFVNDYGFPPALANAMLRKPLVMKIVGDFAWEYSIRHGLVPRELSIDEFQRQRFSSSVERLRALQVWYARRADLIITPSRYLADIVAGWGVPHHRVRVIGNAPPPDAAVPDRSAIRRELGLAEDDLAIASIARLAPWKGVEVLIRAVSAARRRAPRLRLLVVGDGDERSTLERLAEPLNGAVRFLGELSRERALEILAAADGLALCSAYEGLSHVLLEAMAAGKPIVATSVGGNLELISDGRNGLLVPYGDVGALERALVRIATDPRLAERLAEGALMAARVHAWPGLVDATLTVFDEALRKHGARQL